MKFIVSVIAQPVNNSQNIENDLAQIDKLHYCDSRACNPAQN